MENHQVLSESKDKEFENMQSEQQRLTELFLNSPSIIAMTKGREHTFEMANRYYLQLIGNKDVIGKTVKEVRPELEAQGLITILDQVYKTGQPFSANEILFNIDFKGDGNLVDTYLNVVYQAYKNNKGQIEGVLLFANDVTEQVHSRKKVEENEKLYRLIVETSQEGIWMIDKNKRTTFVNKKLCEILEYSPEEIIGKENTFFMDDDGKEIATNAGSERKLGMTEKIDIPLLTKSGKRVWVTLSGSTFIDNDGQYEGGLAMVMDITKQKLAQESLQFNEQRFRALIENSEDLLTLINPDGIVTYISPSAERVLGYTLAQSCGHSAFEIIHPEDIETAQQALQKSLQNPGKTIQLEFRNRNKDGNYVCLSGTLINMLNIPGVNQIVANTRDITQHKNAENLRQKNAALLAEAQHIAKYGNWNLDIASNKFTWSNELYNVFGIEMESFDETFSSYISLIDENDRDYVLQASLNTQMTGQPHDLEYSITTLTGEKRIIHDTGYAEHDLTGKVFRVYGTAQNITERKKAAEELIREKNLSNAIINNLTGLFYLLDINGNFLRWNKNVETVLGYNAAEISKLNAIDLFSIGEKVIIVKKIKEVFLLGKAEVEACLITKSGEEILYYFKATNADFEGISCLIGMGIDITERKRAEAIIKESEAKYRAFFENSMDAILIIDAKGQILEANPAAALVLRMNENNICSLNVFDLFDPGNPQVQKVLQELHKTGKSKGELTMLRKDGTQFPCEVAVVTYKDGLNEVRTSKIIRDITERKGAEEGLIKVNERYRLATKATSNAIWDWNLLNDQIHWSEGYQSTFGYNTSDRAGSFKDFAERIHPADFERVNKKIMNVILGNDGDYWEDEYQFIKADGTTAYVYDRGNLVYDENEKPVRFVGAMQDITSKKEIETERELLIKELVKSNADLKQFSYITSHNLRSPLSNITAILDLINYSSLDAYNVEMLKMLRESGKQLSSTVQDLTNILIIKNNINISVTSINIESTFKEILKTFLIELDNIGGTIITDFQVAELKFHKTYLESIFINLISNAIKYRFPDRNLILKISAIEDANDNLKLIFSDNGTGIDLDRHKHKVFGLYQRFNNQIEGHGLGLFIIKSQITALGGNIEVESEVDKGTIFTINFPTQLIK